MRRVNVELLVGRTEVRKMLGISNPAMTYLLQRDSTFPEPVLVLSQTPVWLAPEIEHWKMTRVKWKKVRHASLVPRAKSRGRTGSGEEDQPG